MGDMNWNDNDIDELFREAANEAHVSYDERYWTEMEALLPKKRRSRLGLWWISSVLLTGVFAFVWILTTSDQHATSAGSKQRTTSYSMSGPSSSSQAINLSTSLITSLSPERKSTPSQVRNNHVQETIEKTENQLRGPAIPSNNENEVNLVPEQVERLTARPLTQIQHERLLTKHSFPANCNRSNNQFFVEGGLGISQAWTIHPGAQPQTTWSATLGYNYSLNKHWYVGGQVGIRHTSLRDIELNRSSKVYHFSSSYYQQAITYKDLFAIQFGVAVGFRGKQHSLELGFQPSLIAGAKMRYEMTVNGEVTDQKELWGSTLGLKPLQLNAVLGYQFAFTNQLAAGMRVQINGNTLTPNTFTHAVRRFPVLGEVTFRYAL